MKSTRWLIPLLEGWCSTLPRGPPGPARRGLQGRPRPHSPPGQASVLRQDVQHVPRLRPGPVACLKGEQGDEFPCPLAGGPHLALPGTPGRSLEPRVRTAPASEPSGSSCWDPGRPPLARRTPSSPAQTKQVPSSSQVLEEEAACPFSKGHMPGACFLHLKKVVKSGVKEAYHNSSISRCLTQTAEKVAIQGKAVCLPLGRRKSKVFYNHHRDPLCRWTSLA